MRLPDRQASEAYTPSWAKEKAVGFGTSKGRRMIHREMARAEAWSTNVCHALLSNLS